MGKRAVGLCLGVWLLSSAHAVMATRDPTIPLRVLFQGNYGMSASAVGAVAPVKHQFQVTAILMSRDGKLAVVDGEVVGENDQIGNARVKTIEKERVVLVTSEGEQIELKVLNVSVKG